MGFRQDLFSFTLNQLRNGKTQEQLSEKLNEVIQKTGIGDNGHLIHAKPPV
jgi:hypothetical protein